MQNRILVVGTGPVGLLAALALSDQGFPVLLAGPAPNREDRRTTAVMMPGLRFLGTLGVDEALKAAGAPLRAMRILDGTSRLLRSPPVTFRAGEIGEDAFGWNIPNQHLIQVLDDAVSAEPRIERRAALVSRWNLGEDRAVAEFADGTTAEASLVVAADGRTSPAREAAGISVRGATLPQTAMVLSFAHSRDHNFTSTEFHGESGPFTQVPLPGRRSSLVWVERPRRAAQLSALSDDELAELIGSRMQSMLGDVSVEPGRQLFPLSTMSPSRYGARRVALVGEAAHTIPPIGAQGFNLGIRDVRQLMDILAGERGDAGAPAVLERYDAARRFEVMSRSAGVNLLNGSLLSSLLPVQAARSLGLAALSRIAPLRALLMREGLETGSGFRASLPGGVKARRLPF